MFLAVYQGLIRTCSHPVVIQVVSWTHHALAPTGIPSDPYHYCMYIEDVFLYMYVYM